MDYILGIDVGTTGCKATVFDHLGQVCLQAYEEYPTAAYTGMIFLGLVWDCICVVIRQCTRHYPSIAAICATSFGESVVAVGKGGAVLGDAFLYTNDSARQAWQQLDAQLGADWIYERTGYISHPIYTVSRLLWMRQNQPELYQKTEHFLFFGSFTAWKLGGVAATEDTHAARSMMYDLHTGTWCPEILSAAGLDAAKLPPIIQAGTQLGLNTAESTRLLGLDAPAMVIAGGQDQPCVALGRPLYVPEDVQAGTRGAYLIAALSLGWINSYEPSAQFPVRTVSPAVDEHRNYPRFCQLLRLMQNMR